MKCVCTVWGKLKRGFGVMAPGEMVIEDMGPLEKGLGAGGIW